MADPQRLMGALLGARHRMNKADVLALIRTAEFIVADMRQGGNVETDGALATESALDKAASTWDATYGVA